MSTLPENQAPEGYLKDAKGRLVPIGLVSDIDSLRNDTIMELVDQAMHLNENLKVFKRHALEVIDTFTMLSAEKYQAKLGGKKGNLTLTSFDGRYKVQRTHSEYLTFDERLAIAKGMIDECIKRWTENSRDEIQVLVNDAFKTNSDGKLSTTRVLGLRRLKIKDPEWVNAMDALTDSIQVTGSKTYIRVYERIDDTDNWERIGLDIADV